MTIYYIIKDVVDLPEIFAVILMPAMVIFLLWGILQMFDFFESESSAKKTRDKTNGGKEEHPITENHEHKKETAKTMNQKYNTPAIVGIILSVISIFGIGLAGLVGFILGIVALTQIKHTHEKGRGVAIAAIIVGLIWSFGVGILRRLVEAGF